MASLISGDRSAPFQQSWLASFLAPDIISYMPGKPKNVAHSKRKNGVEQRQSVPKAIAKLSESAFYKRLNSFKNNEAVQLRLDVNNVVDAAQSIADQVVRFLPQFTDHAGKHLFNVLSYMEHLAGEENIAKMTPLELALAILAAFTHDLGMALSAEDLVKMADSDSSAPAANAWRIFRDEHELSERIRSMEALAKADKERPLTHDEVKWRDALLGQIRADYIRVSHAKEDANSGYSRIAAWIQRIRLSHSPRPSYQGFEFWLPLSWLAMSHNQPIYWLSDRLNRGAEGFQISKADTRDCRISGAETVDWLFLSWLLRLADIMDFDASRTPVILFDHAGIANPVSRIEWLKHRMIPELPAFNTGPDHQTLLYVCPSCPSPEVEKAIHQTIGWINSELDHVRQAQFQTSSGRLALNLPLRARVEIKQRKEGYIYQETEFRLARDAVLELLMGEALYGDPALALRELVQNALDALHLRELRSRLLEKLRANGDEAMLAQPVDPLLNEKLLVQVTWGKEESQGRLRNFIRISDNGVGMTLDVIQRFLTQIGKSYYRSEDFRREVSLMRQHGLLCTTISQFGIGFLSTFMLADHVTVRTRACSAKDDDLPLPEDNESRRLSRRFPLRAEINGTHGLIGIYPDKSVKCCGTEVTLWLKKEFRFTPWYRSAVIGKIGRKFYGDLWPYFNIDEMNRALNQRESDIRNDAEYVPIDNLEPEDVVTSGIQSSKEIDPAFEVASHIVWPLYPVTLAPCGRQASKLELDDSFHFRELVPINRQKFDQITGEWNMATTDNLRWRLCDWQHVEKSGGGTGSRVRLVVACPEGLHATPEEGHWSEFPDREPGDVCQTDRNMFIEPQLPKLEGRTVVLINGILLSDKLMEEILKVIGIESAVGSYVWVDLRGEAAPRIRADRRAITSNQDAKVLVFIKAVLHAWSLTLNTSSESWRWIAHATKIATAWSSNLKVPESNDGRVKIANGWCSALRMSAALIQRIEAIEDNGAGFDDARDSSFPRAVGNAAGREVGGYNASLFDGRNPHTMSLGYGKALKGVATLLPEFAVDLNLARDLGMLLASANLVDSAWIGRSYKPMSEEFRLASNFHELLRLHLVPHVDERHRHHLHRKMALWIQTQWLNEGLWPSLHDANALLAVPGDKRCLNDLIQVGPLEVDNLPGRLPDWLQHYHVCAPLTGVPLPALRAACPEWTVKRWMRSVFMLPFIFGQAPWWFSREHEGESILGKATSCKGMHEFLRQRLGLESLLLFLPAPELWHRQFNEHTREEWAKDSVSAWWHLPSGKVLYADGIHTEDSIQAVGLVESDWVAQSKLPELMFPLDIAGGE
jgi:hypothetical protein